MSVTVAGQKRDSDVNVEGNLTVQSLTASQIVETDSSKNLITVSKNTAYNKNFGTAADTVCEGNDSRLSDARTPVSHDNTYHTETYITSAGVTYENLNTNGDVGTGASQVAAGNHTHSYTFQYGHTYAISGEIKVPSGSTDYIVPFYVPVASGTTVKLIKAKHSIYSGTSATVKLTKNGTDLTGFTNISVTTTDTVTDGTDATLADGDEIALVVTEVSGTPTHLSFTIYLEVTI